jgi:WD40 repeat protein
VPRENAGDLPGQIAFSPRGDLLALNHTLKDVKLLDPGTGRELASLPSPEPQVVERLVMSPSGSHLAVVGADGSVQLWDLDRISRELTALGLGW